MSLSSKGDRLELIVLAAERIARLEVVGNVLHLLERRRHGRRLRQTPGLIALASWQRTTPLLSSDWSDASASNESETACTHSRAAASAPGLAAAAMAELLVHA